MQRDAQAPEGAHPVRRAAAPLAVLAALLVSGCSMSGPQLDASEVDGSLVTSEVAPPAVEPEKLSDQATIRDAVSSADLEAAGGQVLAWANAETGSRGAITALNERRDKGQLCRSFTTSRESYDGVSMFEGQACKAESGPWRLLNFKPL